MFSWRARLTPAIVFCGVPAVGKSYLAADRQALAPAAAPEHYSDAFSQATYAQLGRRAASELGRGGGVLADATLRRRRDRDAFAEALGKAGPLLFVECLAHAEVLAGRARARQDDPSRVSGGTWRSWSASVTRGSHSARSIPLTSRCGGPAN